MKLKCQAVNVARSSSAEQTRQQILDAALRQFAARGYAGTSTQVIIEAAHVTKPVLYYHFGSKAGLFQAAVDRTENQLLEVILKIKAVTSNVHDQLVEICAALFQFARDYPTVMGLALELLLEAMERGPSCKHCLGKMHQRLAVIRKIMEQGVKERTLCNQFGSQQLAVSFLGLLHFHILFHLANPRSPLTRRTAEEAVCLFLAGAATEKSKHFVLNTQPKKETTK
jgi:AcrR family transcriptional regulator